MNSKPGNLYKWSAVIAVIVLIFCSWYPPIQQLANEQVDAGLNRAVITFASARTLNGLISVIQGTEFSVQPLGVGITLTLGQILDPINDLIEQLSSIMLFASVAFGVQKMLLAIGGHWVVSSLVTILAVVWAVLCCIDRTWSGLTKLVLIVFLIRLAIPLVTIGSDLAFQRLMADKYKSSQESLLSTSKQIEVMTPNKSPALPNPPVNKSTFEKLKDGVEHIKNGVTHSMPDVNYEAVKKVSKELPVKVVDLIVVFIMQTVIIPLLLLYVLCKFSFGAGSLIHTNRI